MKAQSVKLRTLITIHALYKYSDENHPMSVKDIKPFMELYHLDCSSRAFKDTLRVMKEYHFELGTSGTGEKNRIWIKNRPFSPDILNKIIYAVTTNPHLTETQADEILTSLKPFVTVYQEEILKDIVVTCPTMNVHPNLFYIYSVVYEAIRTGKRVVYSIDCAYRNPKTQFMDIKRRTKILFSPKWLYQAENKVYMIGYDLTGMRMNTVDLSKVVDMRLAMRKSRVNSEKATEKLNNACLENLIPSKKSKVVYEGPITFHCKGSYLAKLYSHIGNTDRPIKQTHGRIFIYHKNCAVIDTDFLYWLSCIPNRGICIAGPEEATMILKEFFEETSKRILKRKFTSQKSTG